MKEIKLTSAPECMVIIQGVNADGKFVMERIVVPSDGSTATTENAYMFVGAPEFNDRQ